VEGLFGIIFMKADRLFADIHSWRANVGRCCSCLCR